MGGKGWNHSSKRQKIWENEILVLEPEASALENILRWSGFSEGHFLSYLQFFISELSIKNKN